MEQTIKIIDEEKGYWYEVSSEDGIGNIEIRSKDLEGNIVEKFCIDPDFATLIADAILKLRIKIGTRKLLT